MPKTMKVRVLVKIHRDDETYTAMGWSNLCEDGVVRHADERHLTGGDKTPFAWIEADVPVPETPTVKGEVLNDV